MEDLLAYAYLMLVDSEFDDLFDERLNELFLADPDNDDLLYLETLFGNVKESVIYITNHIDYSSVDTAKFGKQLMNLLKTVYKNKSIKKFTACLYNIWQHLWGSLTDEDPFYIMCYAGDPLDWGDEKQARELCEKILYYYDY